MEALVKINDIERYGSVLLNNLVEVGKKFSGGDEIGELILSGDPDKIWGKCGFGGSVELAEKMSESTKEDVVASVTDFDEDVKIFPVDHVYLTIPSKDIILDASAGQFIPRASRVGYEKYFMGNMFIGPRFVLREITHLGVVNTRVDLKDVDLSFRRIWGTQSVLRRPSKK